MKKCGPNHSKDQNNSSTHLWSGACLKPALKEKSPLWYDSLPHKANQVHQRITSMSDTPLPNKYQLSGFDDRERGFSREVELHQLEGQFYALFRYETLRITTDRHDTEHTALLNLIQHMQDNGYTLLRSRLHFRGKQYLGDQEIWEEHPAPEATGRLTRLFQALRITFRCGNQST